MMPVLTAPCQLARRACAVLLLMLCASAAWGHAASKSQVVVRIDDAVLQGELTASLVDVALALHVAPAQPPEQLRLQIAERDADWRAYVARGLVVFLDGQPTPLEFGKAAYGERQGEPVLVFPFRSTAPARIGTLDLLYTLFFEDDTLHEGLARVEWLDGPASDRVFRLGEPLIHFERGAGRALDFWQYARSGAWHVWTGADHVLFLLALLLPSVLLGAPGAWSPAPRLSTALVRAATIVTAFTLAHTLTLGLSALWRIQLPSRIVEPAIAATVFVAAASNLIPRTAILAGAWMAFGFGLIHGAAFAQVLGDLIADRTDIWRPLLAFNLGVEFAQLAIVVAFFPLAWRLRATRFYRRVVVGGGSALVCAVATVWFFARILSVNR